METKTTMKVEAHEHEWVTLKVAWDADRDVVYVLLECQDETCQEQWTRELYAAEPA